MTQWQICGDAIKLVWDTVCSAIETIVNVIKGVFDVATAVIRGDWEGAATAVRNIWNAIGGFFSGLGSRIAGFFSSACSRIAGFFSGAGNSVKAAWNGVVNWFAGLPGRIMGIFAGAGSWLAGAGQAIMDGLLGGLKSAWNNVTSFVGGIGDWIKSHKGPPSYDRIMLVENGKLIMSGFAKGLTSGFDSDVRKAITSVNGRLKTMPLNMTAAAARGAKDTATPITVNVEFNGVVGDPEGVARQINKLLDDYTAKRR
jgi:phage-related protein